MKIVYLFALAWRTVAIERAGALNTVTNWVAGVFSKDKNCD